jgi:transglutaminase-like putative cysteine protease
VHQLTPHAGGATVTGWALRALQAAAAGLALALTATSLTGVLAGVRWWGYVVLSITVVVTTGILLRWLRMPSIVTAAGQLTALLGVVTAVFTTSVVPGSHTVAQISAVLAGAVQQIRVGLPPLPESPELHCLVAVIIGLVAVAVDIVAVSVAAPACAGLVLLCVVTVPTVVSARMLPWWSFALGAAGFAVLLALDTARRQLTWGETVGAVNPAAAAPAAVGIIAIAMVIALITGATMTAVGTGRSSGTPDHAKVPINGIGLNPFTSLRGQLSTEETVALMRIRGLRQRAYLRALTLSRFTAGAGWQQGPMDSTIPADDARTERLPLPAGVATPVVGSTLQVQIEPINFADHWLPTFGYPLSLAGISPDWRYDPNAITVFSEHRQRAEPYMELGVLPQGDPQLLRAVGPAGGEPFHTVDPRYLETGEVDQRVVQLAARLTAGTHTAFDATVALNRWFTQPSNGFSYDLRTVPGNSGDALVDFLFTGHRGYCEQFASAMAIMLRTLRVPARVAVGFTPGTVIGSSRLITTEDAHAWVEAWFPGAGWLPFDPTPLSDGRTVVPPYVVTAGAPPPSGVPLPAAPVPAAVPPPAPDARAVAPPSSPNTSDSDPGAGLSIGLTVIGLGFGVLAGLIPMGVREGRRRLRMRLIGAGGPGAAQAAWDEVLAESADRGVVPPVGETVRASAQRLIHQHGMDEPGGAGLRLLVGVVERSWYAAASTRPDNNTEVTHTDHEIRIAVDAVLTSMARSAPLSRMARLFPRSVLTRTRTR